MRTEYFKGNFGDQLWPAVASGHRTVEATVGHKWVRVREAVRWPTNRKRVSRKIWDALNVTPRERPRHLDIKV